MRKFAFICCGIILMPMAGKADIIFFKDGMKTVCQGRAWEENQEVKCEYEGTVLSYQKQDVLRIQQIKTEKKMEPPSDQIKIPAKPAGAATQSPNIKSPDSQLKPSATKDSKTVSAKPSITSTMKGLEFYNPRRPQKYWTSPKAKFQTFKEAIADLAKEYDRSPAWIKQYMGETNDLDEIHRNLAGSRLNTPVEAKAAPVQEVSETLFYNPRRPYKYWTSATSKHKTFKQAIAALAQEYRRSQQWVRQNMGDSNSLNEIHQNLRNQKLSETSP